MTRSTPLGFALALVAATAACGGASGDNSAITAPTGTMVTDTFTGTVPVGGLDFHNFTVTTGGTVNATLVAAGPPPTITMGFAIGHARHDRRLLAAVGRAGDHAARHDRSTHRIARRPAPTAWRSWTSETRPARLPTR